MMVAAEPVLYTLFFILGGMKKDEKIREKKIKETRGEETHELAYLGDEFSLSLYDALQLESVYS